jgi:hypothetical protein
MIWNEFTKRTIVSLWGHSHLLIAHIQSFHLLIVALIYILLVFSVHKVYGQLIFFNFRVWISLFQSIHVVVLLFENDFIVYFVNKFNLLSLLLWDLSMRRLKFYWFLWSAWLFGMKCSTGFKSCIIHLSVRFCNCIIWCLLWFIMIILQNQIIVHNRSLNPLCNLICLTFLGLVFMEPLSQELKVLIELLFIAISFY